MERDTRRRRPEEPERRPAPQRRRRNKRSPLSNSMLYIVMVCAVSIVLAAVGWSLANDMLALNKDKVTATIVVDDENDFGSVVDQLKDNDIIKYKGLFRLFSALSGGSDKIAQGSYLVDTDMDYRAILNSLGSGSSSRVEVSVTIQELLTVASMIEKETDGTDRTTIASVIYNRLNNPGAGTTGHLNIDATIQYVLPEGEIVSEEDYYTVESPYNTYLNKGLPPGPIANPGLESIMAALNPESTNYYYYALGDDGVHHFFTSYSEHQAFLNS